MTMSTENEKIDTPFAFETGNVCLATIQGPGVWGKSKNGDPQLKVPIDLKSRLNNPKKVEEGVTAIPSSYPTQLNVLITFAPSRDPEKPPLWANDLLALGFEGTTMDEIESFVAGLQRGTKVYVRKGNGVYWNFTTVGNFRADPMDPTALRQWKRSNASSITDGLAQARKPKARNGDSGNGEVPY